MQSTEQLAHLIDRKHQVLSQLRELGRRQMQLVAARDTAALIKVLALKQRLITGLQSVELELSPFTRQDPDGRLWKSPEERARCAAQAEECNRMLREIVHMEKQGLDQMTVHRNEIAQQLDHVHAAADVRNAYQANQY